MFKNKKIIFILFLVVGYVWYQVFFRIQENFFNKNIVTNKNKQNLIFNISIDRDTIPLVLGYSDPFFRLNYLEKSPGLNPDELSNNVEIQKIKKKEVVWPEMAYYGFLKNSNSKQPLAIIKVDSYIYYVREGETILDGLNIKEVIENCIIIKYSNEIKKICN